MLIKEAVIQTNLKAPPFRQPPLFHVTKLSHGLEDIDSYL